MKCRFCQSQMLPMKGLPPDWGEYLDKVYEWGCHVCPNTVKQSHRFQDSFSILVLHNGDWFEVEQMYILPNSPEPPLFAINKIIFYQDEEGKDMVKSEFVLELNIDAKITPQNVNAKLATILTFS